MTWRDSAACRSEPTELFFTPDAAHHARAVCRRCEVVDDCFDWAMANGEEGVWGGTTDDERRRMRPHRQRCAGCGLGFTSPGGRFLRCVACAGRVAV